MSVSARPAPRVRRAPPVFLAVFAALIAAPACADYVIAPSGGDITGAQLSAQLANGDVTLNAVSGNLIVNDQVTWNAHTLTLSAAADVDVNAVMTAGGTAVLTLNIGESGPGAVNMGMSGPHFDGRVDFGGNLAIPNRYTVNGYAFTLIGAATDFQATLTADNTANYALAVDNTFGVSARVNNLYGQLDGLGHAVKNVAIHVNTAYLGLIGHTWGPVVRNLGVEASAVVGNDQYTGGLAGANDSNLLNVYFVGSVSGSAYVGGLVGANNGRIRHAYVAADNVSADQDAGILAGSNNNSGTISQVRVSGNVRGVDAGGVVGFNTGSIDRAIASGTATGDTYVGGIVGDNYIGGTITNAFSSVQVSGKIVAGGLAGRNVGVIVGACAIGPVWLTYYHGGGLAGENYGTIGNVCATGDVAGGGSLIGGLVGTNEGGVSVAYASGSVSGDIAIGGLAGDKGSSGNGTFANAFYAITTPAGAPINNGGNVDDVWHGNMFGTPVPHADLQKLATFADPSWSIDDAAGTGATWRIYQGHGTPLQRVFLTPMTIGADSAVLYYDGTAHGGPGTWSAVPSNYNASLVLGTATVSGGGVHAGTYPLTVRGLYSTHLGYDIEFVPGALTIKRTPLTITPVPGQAKFYGDADPAHLLYSTGGLVAGDTLSGALARASGENVGTYAYTLGSIAAGNPADYALSLASGSFAIAPKPLSITPTFGQTKVYGESDPPSFAYTTSALVGADSVSGALARAAGENAGTYAYTIGSVAPSHPGNYAVTLDFGTFQIRKAPSTLALSTPCASATVIESQPFTLAAGVSGVNGTSGSVTFGDGNGANLCSGVALVAGAAACTTRLLTAPRGATRTYHLSASYAGDANHDASAAPPPVTVTVVSAADAVFRGGFEPPSATCPAN